MNVHDGDVWSLVFDGTTVRVKDAKGLHDIAVLLARPGVEVHVRDLMGSQPAVRPNRASAPDMAEPGGLGPALDEPARRQYRQRITELDAEIAEADACGDTERAARARAEREWVLAELSAAYGLGGRTRISGDPVERGTPGGQVAGPPCHRTDRTSQSRPWTSPSQRDQVRGLLRLPP